MPLRVCGAGHPLWFFLLSPCRPFLSPCYGDHQDLHSFPTRRSSDLCAASAILHSSKKRPATPGVGPGSNTSPKICVRSEEHTSELQSLTKLVCRLLLEKKTN